MVVSQFEVACTTHVVGQDLYLTGSGRSGSTNVTYIVVVDVKYHIGTHTQTLGDHDRRWYAWIGGPVNHVQLRARCASNVQTLDDEVVVTIVYAVTVELEVRLSYRSTYGVVGEHQKTGRGGRGGSRCGYRIGCTRCAFVGEATVQGQVSIVESHVTAGQHKVALGVGQGDPSPVGSGGIQGDAFSNGIGQVDRRARG